MSVYPSIFDYALLLNDVVILVFFTIFWKVSWYINTWMLNQIFMFFNELKFAVGQINIPPIHHPLHPIPFPSTGWKNWSINEVHKSNLNWLQFFPCQCIHLFYIHSQSITLFYSHLCNKKVISQIKLLWINIKFV